MVNDPAGSCRYCAPALLKTAGRAMSGLPFVVSCSAGDDSMHAGRTRAVFIEPAPRLAQQRTRDRPVGTGIATQAFPVVLEFEFRVQVELPGMVRMRGRRERVGTAGIFPRQRRPPDLQSVNDQATPHAEANGPNAAAVVIIARHDLYERPRSVRGADFERNVGSDRKRLGGVDLECAASETLNGLNDLNSLNFSFR